VEAKKLCFYHISLAVRTPIQEKSNNDHRHRYHPVV
ncbi:MAG: hypothetical protein ACI90V_011928, partial [Bacillariaceae sp.]